MMIELGFDTEMQEDRSLYSDSCTEKNLIDTMGGQVNSRAENRNHTKESDWPANYVEE